MSERISFYDDMIQVYYRSFSIIDNDGMADLPEDATGLLELGNTEWFENSYNGAAFETALNDHCPDVLIEEWTDRPPLDGEWIGLRRSASISPPGASI